MSIIETIGDGKLLDVIFTQQKSTIQDQYNVTLAIGASHTYTVPSGKNWIINTVRMGRDAGTANNSINLKTSSSSDSLTLRINTEIELLWEPKQPFILDEGAQINTVFADDASTVECLSIIYYYEINKLGV